ncbi:MAG: hypothetical protein DRP72_01475, partial [Candidatus Omnitrophota bacterium]
AIASPGPLDPIKGVIKNPPNLPGLKNLPLVEILKQRLEKEYGRSFDVFLQHDAAATALGEALFGAGKEFKSFHFMTISTGIGSGIIRNGQIYYGEDGKQFDIGETGMMKGIDPDRPHLNLMQLASGLAIAEEARKAIEKGEKELLRFAEDSKIENITAKTVSEAAKQNNKTAREIIQRAGRYIGLRLVKLIEEGEEHFVLGGGVVKIGPLFINAIKEEIKKHKPTFNTEDNIKIAILGAQAGMLGAISSISHFLVLGAERIGITGGTGSIGSQFIKWLLKRRGSYIDVLVRSLNDRARIRLPLSDFRIRVKQADLLDIEELEKFVIDNDIIFHLAAWSKSGVDISIEEALLVNCISTAFLTQLANKYNKRLVFTSSVVVYRLSQNREGALKENSLILPDNIESFVTRAVEEFGLYVEEVLNKGRINRDEAISFIQNFLRKNPLPQNVDLYGLTKIIGERIVLKYDNSICFRLADVYGPGDETKRIIPTIFKSVLQDMKECQVKDDAKQFIYIDDVLEVLELAIEVKLEEESRIINVPGSKLIRTVEIAEIIKRLANSNIKIVPIPSQSPTIEMDSALLREKFGIIPTTSFDEGIKKTYKWWIEQIASLQKEPTHYLQILIASSEEANKILPRELKKKENLRDEMSKNSKGGGSSHRDKLSAIDCDDAYLLSRFKNNLKIREYIKDLMCFCFGQFGIEKKEVEKILNIISQSNNFDEAREKLYKAGFEWTREGNEYHTIYAQYSSKIAPVTKYENIKPSLGLDEIKENSVFIDIGCGNHALAHQIVKDMLNEGKNKEFIPTIIGVDFPERESIKIGYPDKIKYIQQDINNPGKIPIEGKEIADKILIICALHHMQKDIIYSILDEAKRLLKPEGRVIIVEDVVLKNKEPKSDKEGLASKVKQLNEEERKIAFTIFDWHANHVIGGNTYVPITGNYFSEEEWRKIFSEIGFEVEEEVYIGVYEKKFSNLPHSVFILKRDQKDGGERLIFTTLSLQKNLLSEEDGGKPKLSSLILNYFLPKREHSLLTTYILQAQREGIVSKLFNRKLTWWDTKSNEWIDNQNRLGWLDILERIEKEGKVKQLEKLSQRLTQEGFTTGVVLGIGGSANGMLALKGIFGLNNIYILSSVEPITIKKLKKTIRNNLDKPIFFVISKSWTTVETMKLKDYFYNLVLEHYKGNKEEAGKHFISIADPKEKDNDARDLLRKKESKEYHYRAVIDHDKATGGRYASFFGEPGIAPLSFANEKLFDEIINSGKEMMQLCKNNTVIDNQGKITNPAVFLGLFLAFMELKGRINLVYVLSKELISLATFLGQITAESLGKRDFQGERRGIIPVIAEEEAFNPSYYHKDRDFFIYFNLEESASSDKIVANLRNEGFPFVEIKLEKENIGALVALMNTAIAIASYKMGVNFADEPGVWVSKDTVLRGFIPYLEEQITQIPSQTVQNIINQIKEELSTSYKANFKGGSLDYGFVFEVGLKEEEFDNKLNELAKKLNINNPQENAPFIYALLLYLATQHNKTYADLLVYGDYDSFKNVGKYWQENIQEKAGLDATFTIEPDAQHWKHQEIQDGPLSAFETFVGIKKYTQDINVPNENYTFGQLITLQRLANIWVLLKGAKGLYEFLNTSTDSEIQSFLKKLEDIKTTLEPQWGVSIDLEEENGGENNLREFFETTFGLLEYIIREKERKDGGDILLQTQIDKEEIVITQADLEEIEESIKRKYLPIKSALKSLYNYYSEREDGGKKLSLNISS